MKLKQVISPGFNQAILSISKKVNGKGAFNVAKLRVAIKAQVEAYTEARESTLKKYCELDEDGEVKSIEKTNLAKFKEDKKANEKAFLKELKDIEETEINFIHRIECSKHLIQDPDGDEVYHLDGLIVE